MKFHIPHF